jgi:8-oxo-dGTP diphosphatase
VADCIEREVKEESDLDVRGLSTLAVVNSVFKGDQKHYITLFVDCKMTDPDQKPKVSCDALAHGKPYRS